MSNRIYFGDNLPILQAMPAASVDLIYIDPPFNTGKVQGRTQIKTARSEAGDRTGFGGQRYETIKVGARAYADLFDDYLAFLEPRLVEAHRVLTPHGSLYFHIDYREVHYCKVLLDTHLRPRLLPERDHLGLRLRRPAQESLAAQARQHPACTSRTRQHYVFNFDEIERIPYMAPGLVGPEKAARGKLPTDTWWHTIVPTNGKEKTGYPTQKPLGILRRIVQASSRPGDLVLDFFAGSGTTGAACLELGRRFILVDDNPQAIEVMQRRFAGVADIEWIGCESADSDE